MCRIKKKIRDVDTLSISNLYIDKLLQDSGPVELLITNNTLIDENLEVGSYSIKWQGKDRKGQSMRT